MACLQRSTWILVLTHSRTCQSWPTLIEMHLPHEMSVEERLPMDRPKGYFGEEQIPSRATFLADDNSSFHSNNVFKEQSQAKESDVKTLGDKIWGNIYNQPILFTTAWKCKPCFGHRHAMALTIYSVTQKPSVWFIYSLMFRSKILRPGSRFS